MRKRNSMKIAMTLLVALLASGATPLAAATLNLVVMAAEDTKKETPKYQALCRYIQSHGSTLDRIELKVAANFQEAAELFRSGKADGMVSGSFVGAVLVKKGLARPVVRPRLESGASKYRALVVARQGSAQFSGPGDLKGQKVAYCALASAGEIYVRSLIPPGDSLETFLTPVVTANHEEALRTLLKGNADYAVVKDLIWKPAEYNGLTVIGEDKAEHPNSVLLLTPKAYETFAWELRTILTKLSNDASEQAVALRKAFNVKSYINTTEEDFGPTFRLMDKAGIDPLKFDFRF